MDDFVVSALPIQSPMTNLWIRVGVYWTNEWDESMDFRKLSLEDQKYVAIDIKSLVFILI